MLSKLDIIFEDSQILVINKPSGLVVNQAETQAAQTLESFLVENYPERQSLERYGIVHRLDKETSGVLILAKTKLAQEKLKQEFADRIVKKHYITLLHGSLIKEQVVKSFIERNPFNRERFMVSQEGREAQSEFVPQQQYTFTSSNWSKIDAKPKEKFKLAYQNFTLCDVYPKTGRTHQIRVHAKFLNHPVVSDLTYAGRKRSRVDRKWCPRLFLHAASLTIAHPESNEHLTFRVSLPDDLSEALSWLNQEY